MNFIPTAAQDLPHRAARLAGDTVDALSTQAHRLRDQAVPALRDLRSATSDYVHQRPVQSLLVAGSVVVLLVALTRALMGRSRE